MFNSNEILDMVIQTKFKKVLDAKREGKLYDFRLELRKELQARSNEIRSISAKQWITVEKILNQIEKSSLKDIH